MKTAHLTIEEVKPILAEFGRRHSAVQKLEVFGSVATGETSTDSDLDVLVTFNEERPSGLDSVDFFLELEEELKRMVGHRVDLVDRSALKKDLFGYNANLRAKAVYERP